MTELGRARTRAASIAQPVVIFLARQIISASVLSL